MKGETKFVKLIDDEVQRILEQTRQHKESQLYYLSRFAIRTLRIAAGICMGLFGAWLLFSDSGAAGVPLAQLTIRDLATIAFELFGGAAFCWWAFSIAFGAADETSTSIYEIRLRAEKIVDERLRTAKENAERIDAERAASARWYRHGRFVGMLFDKNLAKRHPWLPWVALPATYAIVAAIIWAIA